MKYIIKGRIHNRIWGTAEHFKSYYTKKVTSRTERWGGAFGDNVGRGGRSARRLRRRK